MFKQRFLTAIILGPLVLWGVFGLPAVWFSIFAAVAVLIGAKEWINLSGVDERIGARFMIWLLLLGAVIAVLDSAVLNTVVMFAAALFWCWAVYLVLHYPQNSGFKTADSRKLIGFAVLLPTWLALSQMKAHSEGNLVLMLLLLLVWGADIGAYCAGKLMGKRKLIPRVSPGKTLEGFLGGAVTCLVIGIVYSCQRELALGAGVYVVCLSLITFLAAVFGDLF